MSVTNESKKYLYCNNQECRTSDGYLLVHSECIERQKTSDCHFKTDTQYSLLSELLKQSHKTKKKLEP